MRPVLTATLLAVSLVLVTTAAHAQGRVAQRVIVTTAAPVFLLPDNTRQPLRVASVGSLLIVLKDEGDWYNVEFRDPQFGTRVGYVEKRFVRLIPIDISAIQPMDLSVDPPAGERPAERRPESQPPTRIEVPSGGTPSKPRHDGFWFNAGFGYGTVGCEDCIGRDSGGTGGLTFGATINDKWLVGVGTSGFARTYLGETFSVGTLDSRFRFYPSSTAGFFITFGLGLGHARFLGESEVGVGANLGLGWDLRVGSNMSLTPFWNGFVMSSSDTDYNVGQIGLGITIH